tara:strand:- start:2289 stop:2582 length:294 start_codon:yes stop_codon:yes gene_type:complete
MIIYIDIDETICEYNGERNYPDAIPINKNIEKVNKLYEQGNTIVYWTARGAVTKVDWTDLTKSQLKTWGAKFHQLRLDKPHYDMLICDKVTNTEDYF